MPVKTSSNNYNIGEHFSRGPLLKSVDELDQEGVATEMLVRVDGVRVVYINYAVLQHDFPQLRDAALEKEYPRLKALKGGAKKRAIQSKIEDWLVRNTAFTSQKQTLQSIVNTPIATGYETVKAFRPPGYGRAVVLSVEENNQGLLIGDDKNPPAFENRLIDIKGVGVAPDKHPVQAPHSNGINSVEFALYELVVMELLQRIFNHSKSAVRTLPIYGILDLGFDEKDPRWADKPASLMARRAHRRPKDSGGLYTYGSTGQHVQLEIELLLRKYGVTAANTNTTVKISKENGKLLIYYGTQQVDFFTDAQLAEIERVSNYKDGMGTVTFEGMNIQQTREVSLNPTTATLVDFQSYNLRQNFKNPLLVLVSDLLLRWGGSIWPEYEDYVLPDPDLQIPYDLFAGTGSVFGYDLGEGKSKVESLCQGLAEDFRARKINREMLLGTLRLYLDSLTGHLG